MRRGVHGPLAKSDNTPPPDLDYRPPMERNLQIIHRDEAFLVLSKPTGLLSVPGNKPDLQDCLETRVQTQFPTALTIHRLDRATSGICVMALNSNARRLLGLQFEKRRTQKQYQAVIAGKPELDHGVVDQAIRTDWYNRPKQMVDNCLGRDALTKWRVLQRLGDETRIELTPVTGRSHQLRVHMKWLGHPIIGDEFYAPAPIVAKSDRLMLHATCLAFDHPATGERLEFSDPCPF